MLTPTGVTQEQYLAALKAANPVTHVRFTFPIQNVVLTDQDITVDGGVQYETMLNPDTDLTFGRAICSNLQVQLVNSDKVTNILWSEEFTFEMGVEISGATYWVTLGYFKGTRPEKLIDVDVVDFSATDRMSMFDILADDWLKSLTYPLTVTQMFQSLCTYVGVPYETGDELSNIASRSYSKAPFDATGFTCRDILGWIAEACGTYAKIANNGKCKLVWYHDHQADYTVTESDRYALNVSEVAWITDSTEKKTWEDLESYTWEELEAYLWREIEGERCPFEIKAVKVTMTEDDVGVIVPSNYTDRYNIYQIIDNPYLSTENDTEVGNYITPILTRLTAFGKYIPMTVDCIGNWLIEPGDVITVIIGSNNHAKMPIFCRTLTWNGSCNDIYETTGNLEREPLSMMNREKFKSGGKIHEVRRTIDETYELIQDQFGNYYTKTETATQISTYVGNNAYGKVSGITIDANGISITGSQYVSIASGGYISIGNWKVNSTGLHCTGTTTHDFYDTSYGLLIASSNSIFITPNGLVNDGGMRIVKYTYSGRTYLVIRGDSTDGSRPLMSLGFTAQAAEHFDQAAIDYIYYYVGIYNMSSREVKHDIRELEDVSSVVKRLTPVRFVYDNDPEEEEKFGLIYEDTVDILPEICSERNGTKAIDYVKLVPVLLKEIQSLQNRVEQLEGRT